MIGGKEGERPREPVPVVGRGRVRAGFLQEAGKAAKVGVTELRASQIGPDVNRLLVPLATGGKMIDGDQRLIVPRQRIAVRRLDAFLQPGLPRVPCRLLSQLAAQS